MTAGRHVPEPPTSVSKSIDIASKQRRIVEQLQKDEGYAAHLKRELAATEERISAGRGKLDLLQEFMEELSETPQPVPPEGT
jgi:hypothetical protein